MGELDGKVAIVTGAGRLRGIGRAAAVSLAKLGADVVVTGTGRKPENYPDDEKAIGWRDIESVADLVRAEGRRALPLVADVTNRDHVKNMIDQTIKELGRIDILINNAAYARAEDRVPILDLNEDTFQKVVDIKITGTFLCTKGVVEHMIKQGDGGKIVNISSAAGKRGSANFLAYNAANFGIVGMTQSMAKELGPHNINVNCVCPGAVDTSRMDVVRDDWDTMASNTPIGRNGTDDEVGDFCAYLCTEASSWIHGQSINQNGGTVMEH
ncbi:MAG: short-chain dehydrogenase [Chloroflexi bacterium]|nr:short-chain dehydrogenase [Chloroflexota bacterium]|tara:strand:- start:87 stop:893 length:807 start_codon:yes stop_codon:yes gene_type:complete